MSEHLNIGGNLVAPERMPSGQLRAKVVAGSVKQGDCVTLKHYDTAQSAYVTGWYKVTGLGKSWQERGAVIDAEDARSFGGAGESMHIAGGARQYAYIEAL